MKQKFLDKDKMWEYIGAKREKHIQLNQTIQSRGGKSEGTTERRGTKKIPGQDQTIQTK